MRDYLSKHEHPGAVTRTRGRASLRMCLVAIGVAALAGCGEIVPIEPDGGIVPPDAVAADNADLAALDLGAFGDVDPAFDPGETSYRASFSLLVQQLEVTATPVNPLATVSINGVAVTPGQPSDGILLGAGADTQIDIEVQAPAGNSKTYTIVANQSRAIQQYVYGKASNPSAEVEFGFWMDISGDTLVVGSPFENSSARGVNGDQTDQNAFGAGAAYVFRRQDNTWSQEAYLKASNTDAFDDFGRGVAIDGDVIAVSAPYEASDAPGVDGNQNSDGLYGAGAVYIFRRTGDEWQQEAYLKASNPLGGALFGRHLSLDGDVLVVGAPGEFFLDPEETFDDEFPNDGAVYVFRYDGVTWVEEAIIKASNGELGDQFGFQVAVDDEIIAVGAIGEASGVGGPDADPSDNSAPLSGAVYVFERQDGVWVETDYIKSQSPDGFRLPFPECDNFDECEGDRFGIRVELDGDTLVVGAHLEDSAAREIDGDQTNDDAQNAGAAWVYRRGDNGDWEQEAYLKPSNLDPNDFFGQTIELAGDLLVVGANGESGGSTGVGGDSSSNGALSSGAVHLFQRTGTAWQQIEYIKASNTEQADNFGFNLAMSSSTLVVGAVWESGGVPGLNGDQNDESAPASGAFYLFQ